MNTNDLPAWFETLKSLKFTWTTFRFHLKAMNDLYLPAYKGSALRGGFGYSFRKVCCTMNPQAKCSQCLLNKNCAYAYIFETPQSAHTDIPHQAENYPHPFIIEPPLSDETQIRSGETLEFSLVLIGQSIDFLPYFVFAFYQLGQMGLGKGRGKFDLDRVTWHSSLDNAGDTEIYDSRSQTLNGNYQVSTWDELLNTIENPASNEVHIKFITPTRILNRGKLVQELPFELLVRNLLRRCSLLARIHCNDTWDLPYDQILDTARDQVHTRTCHLTTDDLERYSTRQNRRMKFIGLVGEAIYTGNLRPFFPLLRLGEMVHVGKNTVFGLGKMICDFRF